MNSIRAIKRSMNLDTFGTAIGGGRYELLSHRWAKWKHLSRPYEQSVRQLTTLNPKKFLSELFVRARLVH